MYQPGQFAIVILNILPLATSFSSNAFVMGDLQAVNYHVADNLEGADIVAFDVVFEVLTQVIKQDNLYKLPLYFQVEVMAKVIIYGNMDNLPLYFELGYYNVGSSI